MLNLLRNYNPKDVRMSAVFRMHEGSTEQTKELQVMLTLGCWENIASLNIKKFSVYIPPFQIKILFDYEVLSKYKLFFATAHQKCTLPSRAVQHLYSYTPVSIVFPRRDELDLGKLQLLIIFLFWLKKIKCITRSLLD